MCVNTDTAAGVSSSPAEPDQNHVLKDSRVFSTSEAQAEMNEVSLVLFRRSSGSSRNPSAAVLEIEGEICPACSNCLGSEDGRGAGNGKMIRSDTRETNLIALLQC